MLRRSFAGLFALATCLSPPLVGAVLANNSPTIATGPAFLAAASEQQVTDFTTIALRPATVNVLVYESHLALQTTTTASTTLCDASVPVRQDGAVWKGGAALPAAYLAVTVGTLNSKMTAPSAANFNTTGRREVPSPEIV